MVYDLVRARECGISTPGVSLEFEHLFVLM
jgi:hypothetical protein